MNKYIGENRLTYLWGKIKAFVSNAISGKVDKVSSSADNAIVRFDGTAGAIQNSGVTIDDSNHLTAAKLITSGGTSSQFVKGDGSLDSNAYTTTVQAIKDGDIAQVYGSTSNTIIKNRVYDRTTQDTFYAADSRFIVTHAVYDSSDDAFLRNLSTGLFKASGQTYTNRVDLGEYGILYIGNVAETELSLTTTTTASICTYPQGYLILTFYASMRPGEIIEAKAWFRNDTSWRSLTVTENNKCVYSIYIPNVNYLKAIRIKYSGSNLGTEGRTSLSDVAYLRARDTLGERCAVTKYPTAQDLYGNVTAPRFITRGGTSSKFVKGDGSLDSTSYAALASPALTGTPTAPTAVAGTNTTQIATTAFVQSAVPKDYQVDYSKTYLTFEALESGTFTFTNSALQYSLDDGATWTSLAAGTASPTVSAGNKILWKQTGLTPDSSNGIGTFSSTGNFNAQGNIMSLYYGDNFIGQKDLTGKDYAFYKLFNGNTKLVNAENLILPATTLAEYCYRDTFNGCTSLVTAPKLLATSLAHSCYRGMFNGCTSLTTAPALPATTLVNSCYYYMFYGCTALTNAPELPAATLADYCYNRMFYGCTLLNYIKCLATNISASNCLNGWVDGVASTGTFVKAASMSSWTTGTSGIPSGWTVRTESEMEHVTKGELDDVVGDIETLLASI